MKSLVIESVALVFVIVHSTTSSEVQSKQIQVARIPCSGLSIISDEDRKGLTTIKYTWKFRGMLIDKICTKKHRITVSSYGDLLVENFGKQDHGTYTCEVKLVVNGVHVTDGVTIKVDKSYVISEIECSPHSCIKAKKCYHSSLPNACPGKGDICCHNIRDSDKHLCQHFLGECMERCDEDIQISRADDCVNTEKCCVLLS